MGGKTKSTSKSNSTTTSNQTTSTPGTSFGQTNVLPRLSPLLDEVEDQQAFIGNRVAAPVAPSNGFVAQWQPPPSTFVPQGTQTQTAQRAGVTNVDPNYQPAIDAGITAANSNAIPIQTAVEGGFSRWNDIIGGGGQNPNIEALISAVQADAGTVYARNAGERAMMAGANGAFGGTPFVQQEAFAADENQRGVNRLTAGIRAEDFYRNQDMLLQAPGALQQFASLGTLPAQQLAAFGGMQQENLMAAAAAGDENAQRQLYNSWLQAGLSDENARRAAQEAIAQWQAAYQVEDARTREGVAQAGFQQQGAQAGLDNEFLRWLNQQETLNNRINNLGGVAQIGYGVPGQTSSGTSNTNTTSEQTQKTSPSPLAVAGSVLGAGLQMFGGPGGLFSGSLSALGGLGKNMIQPLPQLPPMAPAPALQLPQLANAYSDRRLKEDVKFSHRDIRGIKWYTFRYKNDPDGVEHLGVMADEVPYKFVTVDSEGYQKVNYNALSAWEG